MKFIFSSNLLCGVLRRFNPSGQCRAAKFWQSGERKGFSPLCDNEFKTDCQKGKLPSPCTDCQAKIIRTVDADIMTRHIEGQNRFGIYPLIAGAVSWIALDLDAHNPNQRPSGDAKQLIEIGTALDIPLHIFSSNSGQGYHLYMFFDDGTRYDIARSLVQAILDRCKNLTALCSVIPGSGTGQGGLIALPFSGQSHSARGSTLLLDCNLKPVCQSLPESVEYFVNESEGICQEKLNELCRYLDIDKNPKPIERPKPPTPTRPGTLSSRYALRVLLTASQKIAQSRPGEQHSMRVRQSRLVGGYVEMFCFNKAGVYTNISVVNVALTN